MSQMRLRICRGSPPSLAINDGLVVTPSRIPRSASASISLRLPVSTNSFIQNPSMLRRTSQGPPYMSSSRFFDAIRFRADVRCRLLRVDRFHGIDVADTRHHGAVLIAYAHYRRFRERLQGGIANLTPQHEVTA